MASPCNMCGNRDCINCRCKNCKVMQCFANTPDRCTRKAIVKQVEKRREHVERISVLDLSTISSPIDYVEESKTDMYSGVDRPSVQTPNWYENII